MRPFWTPLSALHLPDPPMYATPGVLRLLLSRAGDVELLYSGDRMWPAIRHGARFRASRPDAGALKRGAAIVAAPGGVADLYRVLGEDGEDLILGADSVPGERIALARGQVIARADLEAARPEGRRAIRRVAVDLVEVFRAPGWREDPAASVRGKYDYQAPFYAGLADVPLPEPLVRMLSSVCPSGRILVAGCGYGHECFDLAGRGYRVEGMDFSPVSVAAAAAAAAQRGLDVRFHLADLREDQPFEGAFDAVFFTADVYSFIPGRAARLVTLRRAARWVRTGGRVLVSPRLASSLYQRIVLTLQWMRRAGSGGEWGDSHTRWVESDAALKRSFVHVFTARALQAEFRQAGFSFDCDAASGYWILTPAGGAA